MYIEIYMGIFFILRLYLRYERKEALALLLRTTKFTVHRCCNVTAKYGQCRFKPQFSITAEAVGNAIYGCFIAFFSILIPILI